MEHSVETLVARRLRGLVASVLISTGAVFFVMFCTPAPEAAETAIVTALIADLGSH